MRILIIDRKADVLKTMFSKLSPRHVLHACSTPETVEEAYAAAGPVDLIILNPACAEGSEPDLVSRVRALNPEQKILMIYFSGEDDFGVDAMESAILFKPKSMREIVTQIEWLQAV